MKVLLTLPCSRGGQNVADRTLQAQPWASRFALLTALLVVCFGGGAYAQKAPPPAISRGGGPNALLRGVGIDQHVGQHIPLDLAFRDETGGSIHLADLLTRGGTGKPTILILIQYGCPSLCTTILNDTLSTLKVIPQNVGEQYNVWTVSFDPSETPDLAARKKQEYLRSYQRTRPAAINASAGWHFLTGDAGNIARLTQAVGFRYRWDEASRQFIHPAGLIILTPEGTISRYFFGIDYDPTDLRLSLVEASKGKIGSLTDQILLFCYHYDPSTGKYGLAVMNALRVGGALTILLLGGALAMLWRADRRRTRRLLTTVRGVQESPSVSPRDAPEGGSS